VIEKMDELSFAIERRRVARDIFDKGAWTAEANGNADAADDELVEVHAGGEIS
jgi:hypothetical protein